MYVYAKIYIDQTVKKEVCLVSKHQNLKSKKYIKYIIYILFICILLYY